MKLIYNEQHIKNIPKRLFMGLEYDQMIGMLDDFDHKRLSPTERLNMEKQMCAELINDFLEKLPKIIMERISRNQVVAANRISTQLERYYTLTFQNKLEIRCPGIIYNKFPVKEKIKRLA
jgi:hypothetical protein